MNGGFKMKRAVIYLAIAAFVAVAAPAAATGEKAAERIDNKGGRVESRAKRAQKRGYRRFERRSTSFGSKPDRLDGNGRPMADTGNARSTTLIKRRAEAKAVERRDDRAERHAEAAGKKAERLKRK